MAKLSRIQVKRVYDSPEPEDGKRYLVDRLWPRGVRKEDLPLDGWPKEVAPSDGLRRRAHQGDVDWEEFERLYRAELDESEGWLGLVEESREGTVTLLYAARDTERNHALVLRGYLEGKW